MVRALARPCYPAEATRIALWQRAPPLMRASPTQRAPPIYATHALPFFACAGVGRGLFALAHHSHARLRGWAGILRSRSPLPRVLELMGWEGLYRPRSPLPRALESESGGLEQVGRPGVVGHFRRGGPGGSLLEGGVDEGDLGCIMSCSVMECHVMQWNVMYCEEPNTASTLERCEWVGALAVAVHVAPFSNVKSTRVTLGCDEM